MTQVPRARLMRRPPVLGLAAVAVVVAVGIGVLVWKAAGGSGATYAAAPTCASVEARVSGLPALRTEHAPGGADRSLVCTGAGVSVLVNVYRAGMPLALEGSPRRCSGDSAGDACARQEFDGWTAGNSPHPLSGLGRVARAGFGLATPYGESQPKCWAMAVRANALVRLDFDALTELDACRARAAAAMPGLLDTLGS